MNGETVPIEGARVKYSCALSDILPTVNYRVPNDPISLTQSELTVSEGDHLHVVLKTSQGGYYGNVTFTNLNTSQIFSYGQEAPITWRGPTWPSPGTSAEW
jgi:hypothetical protein